MITPQYVVTMARYNAWQNRQIKAAMEGLGAQALAQDRGAFFGSILGTASHLLWGDLMWMSRFDGGAAPDVSISDSPHMMPDRAAWALERFKADARILLWAEKLKTVDLVGDLSWYSAVLGRDVSKPMGLCVMHLFNHQTHHRGQIHALLTAAGAKAPTTDLPFMPGEGPWL